jgi:thiamine-phosphate pyrophosphorylase
VTDPVTQKKLPAGAGNDAGALLRQRLADSYLYLVTPASPGGRDLDEFLPRVLEAGVDMVQLREKDAEAGPLLRWCEVVRRRTSEFGALFIVNDRVDVALAAGADGVHLGQDDLPVAEARRQMGAVPLIGLSTHSERQFVDSLTSGADYAAVGPVYSTPTKPGRPAVGLDLVGFAADRATLPVFAIGAVDESKLARVMEAGGRRVSVVRALTESGDPASVASRMSAALRPRPPGRELRATYLD